MKRTFFNQIPLQTQIMAESVVHYCEDEDDRARQSAELFAMQLMHQGMELNVCGMFILSNQFTSEVILLPRSGDFL